jgi:hypothetical protein
MQHRSNWRWIQFVTLFSALCLTGPTQLFAQSKNQFGSDYRNRRTVSPWLSTLDNGSGLGALNYFNIVRPQQRARQAASNFQNELNRVESSLSTKRPQTNVPSTSVPITTGRMNPTGHPTSYGTTGSYFGGTAGNGNRGNAQNSFGRNGRN